MKKGMGIAAALLAAALLFAGCAGSAGFDENREINVISREDGSGTRGAFIELFGIEEKAEDGTKIDMTSDEASITNNTAVMMTSVAGDVHAIGYISLGSMNDSIKAVNIDGAMPSVENVKNGSYAISRPFNIATKGAASEVAQDFIDYILSDEGQKVAEQAGYIAVGSQGPYQSKKLSGKIVVAGSSSVTPVMEKLKESYIAINPDVKIEIQESDSTTGMTAAIDGICDIGMASRELKDSELQAGLISTVIATDGIAVIVNNENPVTNLTSAQVKEIYTGALTLWKDVL